MFRLHTVINFLNHLIQVSFCGFQMGACDDMIFAPFDALIEIGEEARLCSLPSIGTWRAVWTIWLRSSDRVGGGYVRRLPARM